MTLRPARFGTRWARHAAGAVVCALLAAGASAQGERFELAQTPAPRQAAPARTRALPDFVALVKGGDQAARERVFTGFNTPLLPEILVCTSVGAEGIDLHRHCRHVVHYDLAWNLWRRPA